MRIVARLISMSVWLCMAAASVATAAPPALKASLVEEGYDFSLFATAPPGDEHRLFVVERGGRILLRKDGARRREPFLDTSDQTGMGHEYGLYSLAFHPGYAKNRRFFVYYVDNNAHSRLVEYRAAPDLEHADPNSARVILAQTASSTSASGTARPAASRAAPLRTGPRCWARCSASTWTRGTRTASPPGIPSPPRPTSARRST
jgi:hypothetical protein